MTGSDFRHSYCFWCSPFTAIYILGPGGSVPLWGTLFSLSPMQIIFQKIFPVFQRHVLSLIPLFYMSSFSASFALMFTVCVTVLSVPLARIYWCSNRFKLWYAVSLGPPAEMDIWIAFRKINWSLVLVLQGGNYMTLVTDNSLFYFYFIRTPWVKIHSRDLPESKQNGLVPFNVIFLRHCTEKRFLICAAVIWS